LDAIHEYKGLTNSIKIAPAVKRYGNSSTLATAISFLTGLRIYQDESTKKNKNDAVRDSIEKDLLTFDIKPFVEFIQRIS